MEERTHKKFGQDNVIQVVRNALLDVKIMRGLNATLVISSLKLFPLEIIFMRAKVDFVFLAIKTIYRASSAFFSTCSLTL